MFRTVFRALSRWYESAVAAVDNHSVVINAVASSAITSITNGVRASALSGQPWRGAARCARRA
jgi:hypothetical protein